jgi:mannose-6-phosphate isomerase-like protein (cupin superfamily)
VKQVVLQAGESRSLAGHPARVKASSEDCDDRFCVLESVIGAGQRPVLHLHRKHVEAFYVLEGALDIQAGHDHVPAPAGSFVLCPAGSPHTFSNPGPGEARFFGFAAPGGIDHFLQGLGAILGQPGPPDVEALGELLRRFESEALMGDWIPDGPASTVLGPGEGETMTIRGNTLTILADAAATGGAFGVLDYTAVPGFPGPPPHLHHETAETFFVLEGKLAMRLGDETLTLPTGGFVLVPPGTVHTFSNPGNAPARFLGLVSPGGFEQYFRDLRDAFGDGPPDPAKIGEIASRYDVETVGAH